MNTYILILSIYSGFSGTTTITAVNGFVDQESCEFAGKLFLNRREKIISARPAYICVPSKSTK